MIENQLLEIQLTLKDAPLGQKTAEAAKTAGNFYVEATDTIPEQVDDQRNEQRQNPTVAQRCKKSKGRVSYDINIILHDLCVFHGRIS